MTGFAAAAGTGSHNGSIARECEAIMKKWGRESGMGMALRCHCDIPREGLMGFGVCGETIQSPAGAVTCAPACSSAPRRSATPHHSAALPFSKRTM